VQKQVIISCVPTYGPYVRALAINFPSYRRRPTGLIGKSYGYGQSYALSPRTAKFDTRIYDHSVPTAEDIGSKTMTRNNDSEETILAERESREDAEAKRVEMGIHIATEVTVERRPRDSL
jgi:hypothetical protein